jgi:hypothetical protein
MTATEIGSRGCRADKHMDSTQRNHAASGIAVAIVGGLIMSQVLTLFT